MFVLQDYPVAVLFCVITMLCWGSWANTQKPAGKTWRFELFYWDYVFGVMLMALSSPSRWAARARRPRLPGRPRRRPIRPTSARPLLGGVIFNAANILLVAAIAIAGMSVAFPVGIGLALVLGVRGQLLGANRRAIRCCCSLGVALIAAAIVLDAMAYRKLPGQSKAAAQRAWCWPCCAAS